MEAYDISIVHVGNIGSLGFAKAYKLENVKNRTYRAKNAAQLGSIAKKPLVFFLDSFELDLPAIREVAKSGGAFAFPASYFSVPGEPPHFVAQKLGMARQFAKLCLKYGARIVLCSLSQNEFQCLSAHELVLFAQLFGIPEQVAKASLKLPKLYFE
ncbi:hypothetical protein FJZ26_03760 [Candidatus Parvarchaeota archaeon]|nr:hypothetical protein [Candidatus Parvarchaeota archaeon]